MFEIGHIGCYRAHVIVWELTMGIGQSLTFGKITEFVKLYYWVIDEPRVFQI
jgi:hypothetical protein